MHYALVSRAHHGSWLGRLHFRIVAILQNCNEAVLRNIPTGYSTYAAAVANANTAKANVLYAAEQQKQNAVAQARDTFRATGEANISL